MATDNSNNNLQWGCYLNLFSNLFGSFQKEYQNQNDATYTPYNPA